MTEMESDTDTMSPANIKCTNQLCLPRNDMCYLSPFSSVGRGDRTISESNLSSSGYSSMASPVPSRCGSSNPLYPTMNDTDDGGPSGSNTKFRKIRSNSMQNETLSDDILLESNDEGIGTDHIDEKTGGGQTTSAKQLEHFLAKELIDSGKKIMLEEQLVMSQLQLPTIIIQTEGSDKSPVSSRSESPISERASGTKRFSPLFYSRKEQILPFTDSDGLYDFPSSDGKGNSTNEPSCKKTNTRKRERKLSRGAPISMSPTKTSSTDLLQKDMAHLCNPNQQHIQPGIRKSPKKRPLKRYTIVSSSSSTESLTSDTKARFGIYLKGKSLKHTENDTQKDIVKPAQPKSEAVIVRPYRKINHLRAIGNQIRFLRRLQHSLRAKARSQKDCISSRSCTDDDDMDDSIPSDSLSLPQKMPFKTKEMDTDSVSATQSKSTESFTPPIVIHATKTTRSLSLNAGSAVFSMNKLVRTDAYLDEVNSD